MIKPTRTGNVRQRLFFVWPKPSFFSPTVEFLEDV